MPDITVIMNTNGASYHLIEEAIFSVLNQTYQNFELLIVCTHPDKLRLDKSYSNIEVLNIKPFSRFPEQIYFAINQVKTPYWCIVDSDDYIRPKHLEMLMQGVRGQNFKFFSYGAKYAIYMEKDYIKYLPHNGWWRSVFDKFDVRVLDSPLEQHKTEWGFDSVIEKLPDIRFEQNYEPTYLYRYDVSNHLSKRRGNEQPNTPLPILVPKLYDDYESKIIKFLEKYKFNNELTERNK